MLFNSLYFIIFLPIVVVLYYLIKHRYRWVLLFVASSYFYSVFYIPYVLILYLLILIDYVCGILIEKSAGKIKLAWLVISIVSNIGLLSYFKYSNFFIDIFNQVSPLFYITKKYQQLNILLPIGLSFHTFQSLSYTIEIYRQKQKAETHLGYFANYVLFFPQMVAGPIERYNRLGNELRKNVSISYQNISNGLRLVLYGLFVKMCVADNLAPLVDAVYKTPNEYFSSSVWLVIFAFSIQIYADFYGYSTVAIGAAQMLGINLMDNFKQPYFALSIQDFWKRWHISLSTWFKDYVFISMGGNRVGNFRWIFNVLFLFVVSGFWHGANYTFIIWGLLHGLAYLIEKGASGFVPFAIKQNIAYKTMAWFATFFVVMLIWIFFRAYNVNQVLLVFKQLFFYDFEANKNVAIPLVSMAMFFLIVFIEFIIIQKRFDTWIESQSVAVRWFSYATLITCLLLFSGIKSYPFIYFQF